MTYFGARGIKRRMIAVVTTRAKKTGWKTKEVSRLNRVCFEKVIVNLNV